MAIYLDHAATTPLRREVLDAMLPYLTEHHGNPSSIYASGRRARQALDEARETVARHLGAAPREIVFTSGGTEADNLAIKGVAWAASARGRHVIAGSVEHRAVLHACQVLERQGFEVTYLPVDRYGLVDPDELSAAFTERTVLVSVLHGNNEVGTIQPVAELAARCRERRIPFHTDAVQSASHLALDVDAMQLTLLSLSAHKLGGPKGIGALFVRRGTAMLPQLQGGSQERQRRAGTENVAGAVGLAAALDLAAAERDEEAARLVELRDRCLAALETIDGVTRTGHPEARMPGLASVVIDGVDGGDLVAALDLEGVEASTGSACTSGSTEPSHVLLAMGLEPRVAQGSLRLSLGRETTAADIEAAVAAVRRCVARLREAAMARASAASA